jgi:hypothetical protein
VWECPDAATFAYQPEDTLDQAGAKHPYLLSMAGAFGDNLGFSHDGHYFAADQLPDAAYDADPAVIGRGGYRFQDSRQRAARSVRIDLLDSDFALRATGGEGTADRTVYSDLELHRWSEADIIGTGQWRGVFTAWDNHADRRRDHRSVPMIALNTPGVIPQEQIERAIFCQAVEIIARKQIEKDGWTIFIDPAKGHPFGRGGGPDIGAYRVLPSAGAPRNLEVGVFDQKALGGSSIGVADAPRLTKNGVEAWKQYVRNFLDRDGSGLAAETKVSILSALDDGRLKRTVTDVAGSATALTANAVAEGIELRHVDLTTKEAQRWVKDAVKESKGFMTEFFAKVKRVHDAKPRVARAAKAVLEKFNKLATPIAIACAVVALEQKMARGLSLDSAVSELTDEIGKDLVCYDGLEMLGAQISATAQRMLDRVAKAVLGTRWMRELQKWENPFDVP